MTRHGWPNGARDHAPDDARVAALGARIADAITAWCHPGGAPDPSVRVMLPGVLVLAEAARPLLSRGRTATPVGADEHPGADGDALVRALFSTEGSSLVRLARLFVDDRNAAEDLVQEAFIRLARNTHRINDRAKAPAYLRSIVLNLARDHNRRGLVSLRHHLPFDDTRASTEDELVLDEDRREVLEVLRDLPRRQRDCLVLRYYEELGIDDIASTLGISRNSVKTHLTRGLRAMEARLDAAESAEVTP